MDSLQQLGFDGIEPGTSSSAQSTPARSLAAQARYRATERGKAQARKHQRAWRARQGDGLREKDRVRIRNYTRQKLYGISPEAFDAMLIEQGCVCAICKGDVPLGKSWHVDHDHATGNVRAILCPQCNIMIGGARDTPALLTAAADYLEKHGK